MRVRPARSLAAATCLWAIALPLHARAQPARTQDAIRCVPAVGTAAPVGTTPCFGARPGAFIRMPRTNITCTLGFLFRERKTGRSFMSTSGHCVLPATGKQTWKPGAGPVALDDADKKVGNFVFAVNGDKKDFALLQIARGVTTNAQVCHFGGPVGPYDERFRDPAVLHFYGQAEAMREVLPARSGVTANTLNPDYVYAQAPIGLGDSGGPWIMDDGRAVGYVTHIVAYGTNAPDAGLALVRRLGPQVEEAERALKTRLTLMTAPLLP